MGKSISDEYLLVLSLLCCVLNNQVLIMSALGQLLVNSVSIEECLENRDTVEALARQVAEGANRTLRVAEPLSAVI